MASTASVALDMTDTVFEPVLGTYMLPLAKSKAECPGPTPTAMVAVTVFVELSMRDTVLERKLDAYMSLFAKS